MSILDSFFWNCPICGERVSGFSPETLTDRRCFHEQKHQKENELRLETVRVFNPRINAYSIWSDEKFLRVGLIDPHTLDRRTPQELASRYRPKPTHLT